MKLRKEKQTLGLFSYWTPLNHPAQPTLETLPCIPTCEPVFVPVSPEAFKRCYPSCLNLP